MTYRPEIDGLRGIAVLAVILCHAGFATFSGGFVGVDVFFVISGYLITTLLFTEIEAGTFSIARFYERRVRRLLPALFVVLAACLPFAYFLLLPEQLESFSASLASVIVGLSNLFFLSQVNYFAPAAHLQPLLHTWSLAVEEQYYLLLPPVILLLRRLPKWSLPVTLVLLTLLSFAFAEWAGRINAARNYYFTLSRFWELGVGSLCALIALRWPVRPRIPLDGVGLGLILYSIVTFDSALPFPSAYTLVPVIGAALIVLFSGPQSMTGRILCSRGMVGIGLVSYSAYLWHQPTFAFARLLSADEPAPWVMVCLAVVALLLAWLTWATVERPFRRSVNPVFAKRGTVFLSAGAGGLAFLIVGVLGFWGKGLPWRFSHVADVAALEQRLQENYGLSPDCDPGLPTFDQCATSARPQVLLWGDSFAMHLVPGMLESDPAVRMRQATRSACAPIIGVAQIGGAYGVEWSKTCIAFNDQVMDWLRQQDGLSLVVISSSFSQVLHGHVLQRDGRVLDDPDVDGIAHALRQTVSKIRETGARVVIVSPTPNRRNDTGQCILRSLYFGLGESRCDYAADLSTKPFALVNAVSDDVAVYRLEKDICPDGWCDVVRDGTIIFRDGGHLSLEGSRYMGERHDWMLFFRQMAN